MSKEIVIKQNRHYNLNVKEDNHNSDDIMIQMENIYRWVVVEKSSIPALISALQDLTKEK